MVLKNSSWNFSQNPSKSRLYVLLEIVFNLCAPGFIICQLDMVDMVTFWRKMLAELKMHRDMLLKVLSLLKGLAVPIDDLPLIIDQCIPSLTFFHEHWVCRRDWYDVLIHVHVPSQLLIQSSFLSRSMHPWRTSQYFIILATPQNKACKTFLWVWNH